MLQTGASGPPENGVGSVHPDAWLSGAPMDYYDRRTAENAIELAARIVEFAEREAA